MSLYAACMGSGNADSTARDMDDAFENEDFEKKGCSFGCLTFKTGV